jgi:hypothetical protein
MVLFKHARFKHALFHNFSLDFPNDYVQPNTVLAVIMEEEVPLTYADRIKQLNEIDQVLLIGSQHSNTRNTDG